MKKVRYLIVGTGGMGRAHIEDLLCIADAEIVGLVDVSVDSLEQTKRQFPKLGRVPLYTMLDDALKVCSADAAVIVTPHAHHFQQGMNCLEAGLHVLMEKPFVAGSKNAKTIIDYARSRGRHLGISYQRHVQGPYIYLRHLISNGELGKINYIAAYQAQCWQALTVGTWRQDPHLACGGQLNDSGSHLLDVVLWLTGLEPETVMASIDFHGADVDIDTALTVKFSGGATGSFSIVGSASINWWEDVSIHGSEGTAFYRNGRIFVARRGEDSPTEIDSTKLPDSSSPDLDFTELVLGRRFEAAAPAECGLRVSRLTEAAQTSAREGRTVRFDSIQ